MFREPWKKTTANSDSVFNKWSASGFPATLNCCVEAEIYSPHNNHQQHAARAHSTNMVQESERTSRTTSGDVLNLLFPKAQSVMILIIHIYNVTGILPPTSPILRFTVLSKRFELLSCVPVWVVEVIVHRRWRWTHPEVDSVADSVGERRVDGFIELEQDLKSQLRCDLLSLKTYTPFTVTNRKVKTSDTDGTECMWS